MTTIAVDLRRPGLHRRDAMTASFAVVPCDGERLPRDEDAQRVRDMRRLVAARLEQCGLEAMTDDVLVMVSELLTNALVHSGSGEISLSLVVLANDLRIEVRDGMPGVAEPKRPEPLDESGRGLWLLDALVKERRGTWGTYDAGACTWCELPVATGVQR
ncbi:ATP-binding protein [Streptomyces sp. WSLK1-5]|uniref:ATP-binding protein n=1 Tax=unclassified Streptomyces TaxID=2593676 RepID=UPI0037928C89